MALFSVPGAFVEPYLGAAPLSPVQGDKDEGHSSSSKAMPPHRLPLLAHAQLSLAGCSSRLFPLQRSCTAGHPKSPPHRAGAVLTLDFQAVGQTVRDRCGLVAKAGMGPRATRVFPVLPKFVVLWQEVAHLVVMSSLEDLFQQILPAEAISIQNAAPEEEPPSSNHLLTQRKGGAGEALSVPAPDLRTAPLARRACAGIQAFLW